MFQQYEKINANIFFTFLTVDLKRSIDSKFYISFVRGSTKYSTNKIQSDSDLCLHFDKTFKIKCTIFIDKDTKKIRHKKMQILLHRISSPNNSKIYGEIAIDLAKNYQLGVVVNEEVEMESGRSIAPILKYTYKIVPNSEFLNPTNDKNDPSLFDEQFPKVNFSDWDQTEITSDGEFLKLRKSHRYKQNKSNITQPQIRSIPNEPKKDDLNTLFELTKEILSTEFPIFNEPVFIDSSHSLQIPPSVFPIYSLILHSGVLLPSANENEFIEFSDNFFAHLSNAPLCTNCSDEMRFINIIILIYLIKENPQKEIQNQEHVNYFIDKLCILLNNQTREIVRPLLSNFRILFNRFSTAKFDVDPLLCDFEQVINSICMTFSYTKSFCIFLFQVLMSLLDVELSNKILNNPLRFSFRNSIIWNSFITAFEAFKKIDLIRIKQIISTLVMAPNISQDPNDSDLIKNICPDLNINNVIYILKNYNPDDMYNDLVSCREFARLRNIDSDQIKTYEKIEPVYIKINDFYEFFNEFDASNWNKGNLNNVLEMFKFLKQYTPK